MWINVKTMNIVHNGQLIQTIRYFNYMWINVKPWIWFRMVNWFKQWDILIKCLSRYNIIVL